MRWEECNAKARQVKDKRRVGCANEQRQDYTRPALAMLNNSSRMSCEQTVLPPPHQPGPPKLVPETRRCYLASSSHFPDPDRPSEVRSPG